MSNLVYWQDRHDRLIKMDALYNCYRGMVLNVGPSKAEFVYDPYLTTDLRNRLSTLTWIERESR